MLCLLACIKMTKNRTFSSCYSFHIFFSFLFFFFFSFLRFSGNVISIKKAYKSNSTLSISEAVLQDSSNMSMSEMFDYLDLVIKLEDENTQCFIKKIYPAFVLNSSSRLYLMSYVISKLAPCVNRCYYFTKQILVFRCLDFGIDRIRPTL